jgi:hypothetical protein
MLTSIELDTIEALLKTLHASKKVVETNRHDIDTYKVVLDVTIWNDSEIELIKSKLLKQLENL